MYLCFGCIGGQANRADALLGHLQGQRGQAALTGQRLHHVLVDALVLWGVMLFAQQQGIGLRQ